jgi:hypothetical protein
MKVEALKIPQVQARELWRKYREHLAYQTPLDHEIETAYKAIAQGRTVIRALQSIRAAGVGADGRPKLAIARATARFVECHLHTGWCEFRSDAAHYTRTRSIVEVREFPEAQERRAGQQRGRAPVPIIPVHLRPRRGLFNYHVLWEVEEWTPQPPVDPYLLRRLAGDMWLVVAAWDLTPVERAAMATRLNG